MNKLKADKQVQIISALVEGNSIRATCRMTGAAKGTVIKLLAEVGQACSDYQSKALRDLTCQRIQCDEIQSFCYAKEKNVSENKMSQWGYGDIYTWTAICADSKLVLSWFVAKRDVPSAKMFMKDVVSRLKNRVQLTTDGFRVYLSAVEEAFGSEIDFSQVEKFYGSSREDQGIKYSTPACTGEIKTKINGNPDPVHVSTSYVEQQDLTMRVSMRRFTSLTSAFSNKIKNLEHAVALHFMYYNFCRVHPTLRVTPAMEAKVTDHVWIAKDILILLH